MVGVSLFAQSQPSRTQEKEVAKQEARLGAENPKLPIKEATGSPNGTVIVNKQENPPSHKPDENKDDENIAIQRKLANLTLLLVVVGSIQAAILVATVVVIWKQMSVARHIERAWVMADIEHDSQKWGDRKNHILRGSGTNGDTTGFYAVLVCRNEGKSPAWLGERRAKFEIVM